jgi:hypothetical protein
MCQQSQALLALITEFGVLRLMWIIECCIEVRGFSKKGSNKFIPIGLHEDAENCNEFHFKHHTVFVLH